MHVVELESTFPVLIFLTCAKVQMYYLSIYGSKQLIAMFSEEQGGALFVVLRVY